jgi:L-methionine (R)-S-oxide reductase
VPILDARHVVHELRSLAARLAPRAGLLAAAADEIRAAGPPYTSVYLYMLDREKNALFLEAFSGRETHHTRIPVGTGVCGTAVSSGKDQNIGDVRAVENYLACNLQTRSELVILIRKSDVILGQIDVDSDMLDPFTAEEEAAVRTIAQELGRLL